MLCDNFMAGRKRLQPCRKNRVKGWHGLIIPISVTRNNGFQKADQGRKGPFTGVWFMKNTERSVYRKPALYFLQSEVRFLKQKSGSFSRLSRGLLFPRFDVAVYGVGKVTFRTFVFTVLRAAKSSSGAFSLFCSCQKGANFVGQK